MCKRGNATDKRHSGLPWSITRKKQRTRPSASCGGRAGMNPLLVSACCTYVPTILKSSTSKSVLIGISSIIIPPCYHHARQIHERPLVLLRKTWLSHAVLQWCGIPHKTFPSERKHYTLKYATPQTPYATHDARL